MNSPKTVLPGTASKTPRRTTALPSRGDLSEAVRLVLLLRRRREIPSGLVTGAQTLTCRALSADYGADPADIALTKTVMSASGLEVISADAALRRVVVEAALSTVLDVFDTEVAHVEENDPIDGVPHNYRTHAELYIPTELEGVVVGVFGLDTRPKAAPMFRSLAGQPRIVYTPPELGRLYDFPATTTGSGQTLAIITITGGYRQQDLDAYFAQLGLAVPAIRTVRIRGTDNNPGPLDEPPSPADIEAALDVEIAGSLVPAAQLVNYFTPNTDAGILEALQAAVYANPTPTAISLSWGSDEQSYSAQFISALEDLFMDAAALGIAVCVASGDAGSGNAENDGGSHVNYPASSPHVLAVGGTTLIADPMTNTIHSETVWNTGSQQATGGGVSNIFELPAWQAQARVPTRYGTSQDGRGVPDVAANADAMTGYQVLLQGKMAVVGGTSAATPLWAALACRLAEALQRPLGLLSPAIYAGLVPGKVTAGFRDIQVGDNGAYSAVAGWDPDTGLGSPDGTALLTRLRECLR
jgi:kumamolisin